MSGTTTPGANVTSKPDIYSAAQQCRALFARYLEEPRHHQELIQQYQHQFLTWISFLGVFAAPNASLDARLRDVPDIKDLVLSMLAVLNRNLRQGIDYDSTATSERPEIADIIVRGITGALERLQRLAVAIRQPQRTDEVSRVQEFAQKFDDKYLEDIVHLLIKFRIGDKAPVSLRSQLVQSVLYRRHRLLYQRRHNLKLQRERKQEAEGNKNLKNATVLGSEMSPTVPSEHNLKNKDEIGKLLSRKPEFQQRPGSFMSSNQTLPVEYPRRPSVPVGEIDIACQYCCSKLRASDLKEPKWWRSHMDDDLRLYVCISADCGPLPPSFPSRKDWANHMQTKHGEEWARYIHRPFVWFCPFSHDTPLEFESEGPLQQHLSSSHAENHYNHQQISSVAKISKRHTASDIGQCPLCGDNVYKSASLGDEHQTIRESRPKISKRVTFQGGNEEDHLGFGVLKSDDIDITSTEINKNQLSHHISVHLRTIGFMSLRWWDEDVGPAQNTVRSSNSVVDDRGSNFDEEALSSGNISFDETTLDELRHAQELSSMEEQRRARESAKDVESELSKERMLPSGALYDEDALGSSPPTHPSSRKHERRKAADFSTATEYRHGNAADDFGEGKGKGKHREPNLTEFDQPDPFANDDYEDPNYESDMSATEYLSGYAYHEADAGGDREGHESETDLNADEVDDFDKELALAMDMSRIVAYSGDTLNESSSTYQQAAYEPMTAGYSDMPDPLFLVPQFLRTPSGKNTYWIGGTYGDMEEADPRFRVHASPEFVIGAVFKVLWTTPCGAGTQPVPEDDTPTLISFEDTVYFAYRRFIIVATDEGHSTCVPILTYERRACTKPGVKYKKHGIIYSHGYKPRLLKDEPELGFDPVMLTEYHGVEDRLDKASRVNYSKLVTVEHNVKVRFLGAIDEWHYEIVRKAVNKCWTHKMLEPIESSRHRHSKKRHGKDKAL